MADECAEKLTVDILKQGKEAFNVQREPKYPSCWVRACDWVLRDTGERFCKPCLRDKSE